MDDIRRLVEEINASGQFDANWYRREYPDVASLGIDPAEHYARWGRTLGRSYRAGTNGVPLALTGGSVLHDLGALNGTLTKMTKGDVDGVRGELIGGRSDQDDVVPVTDNSIALVDVVVPVYNALADVQMCLESVLRHDPQRLGELIVVNDGSDAATTDWLRSFCVNPKCRLIEHDQNRGYTRAVNTGLRASRAAFIVTLNSDTVVTPCWLEGMVRCMVSAPDIGLVGPLSNAASWQNVPELYGPDKQFAINALPCSMSADDMAASVRAASVRRYPRSPFLNGFCMMIRREVIEAIGVMDEERFPVGYGEENDFCVRASDAGFVLAVADDTYVFHAKSKSFGHERRKELSMRGRMMLEDKHGAEKFLSLIEQVKLTAELDAVRERIKAVLSRTRDGAPAGKCRGILFLLPVAGGGGGAHSVVQEVQGMRDLGVRAQVGVEEHQLSSYLAQYRSIANVQELFVAINEATLPLVADRYDVIVATIFTSVAMVKRAVDRNPDLLPAYYVQDYEPLFFDAGTEQYNEARASYSLIDGCVLFAKTRWIAQKVWEEHRILVTKVAPSIDHSVYRPGNRTLGPPFRIAAMIRPKTPRRGAERTMRVFSRIAEVLGDAVSFDLFGCSSHDPGFCELPNQFVFKNHGVLRRDEVGTLLGRCHVFVDLSDYQAFGRTGLEAMACGAVSVLPVLGGTDEYAVDGVNAVLVDTTDEEACIDRILGLLNDPDQLSRMAEAARKTADRYSIGSAARSEWDVLSRALFARRARIGTRAVKRTMYLMPARTAAGSYDDTAYTRAILPFSHPAVRRECSVVLWEPSEPLPTPCPGDVLLIQGDSIDVVPATLKSWISSWKDVGGLLIWDAVGGSGSLAKPESSQEQARGVLAAAVVRQVLGKAADTVTLPVGSDLVHPVGRRDAINLEEVLDEQLWRLDHPRDHSKGPFARSSETVRIGLIGQPDDFDEWIGLEPLMGAVCAEFGARIEVEVIGVFEKQSPRFGRRIGLPKASGYPSYVRWLQQRVHWDVGIVAPLRSPEKRRRAFLEYAALNMAIVCPASPGLEALAIDGTTAVVVADRNASVRAVRELINAPERRRTLAAGARTMVKHNHCIRARLCTYLNIAAIAKLGAERISQGS